MPPTLPVSPPPPPPAPPLSPAELQRQQQRALKRYVPIFFSATVYDGQFTEVRWFDGKAPLRVFSNIDFNLLSSVGRI